MKGITKPMTTEHAEQPVSEWRPVETPASGYQPQYQMPYPPTPTYIPSPYFPAERRGPHPVVAVSFWIFYALVGLWVDFALTFSLWVCALVLPFTFPLTWLSLEGYLPGG